MSYQTRLALIISILLAPMVGVRTLAQDASRNGEGIDPKLTFEVASVRPNNLGITSRLWSYRGGRLTLRHVTVGQMIRWAYGEPGSALANSQIFNAPTWLDADHFDVLATAPGIPDSPRGVFPQPIVTMLGKLLEDRFKLRVHFETKEFPLFALVLARKDGTLGPGLRRRTVGCTPSVAGDPLPTSGASDRRTCGGRFGPGFLTGNNWTMANVKDGLAQVAPGFNPIVIDRTGLTGLFDVDLRWAPDSPVTSAGQVVPPVDSNASSFFTALQEQLGLKLESTRGPVDVLVIDQVEQPTSN